MSRSKEQSYPVWLRFVVIVLLVPGLITACLRPASTALSPTLSPETQTQAAVQGSGDIGPATSPTSLLTPGEPSAPVATPEPEFPTVQVLRARVGLLRYNSQVWEAVKLGEGVDQIAGVPYYQLVHRSLKGCILQEAIPREIPSSWSKKASKTTIGNLTYRQEMWINANTERRVLAVYQFPTKQPATRYELAIKKEPNQCIRAAREVLALSEDLVTAP